MLPIREFCQESAQPARAADLIRGDLRKPEVGLARVKLIANGLFAEYHRDLRVDRRPLGESPFCPSERKQGEPILKSILSVVPASRKSAE